jgi:hypothetical protein
MKPPALAERLMRWSLAPDERPAVLGDLEEEFSAIAAKEGESAARRWYYRQTVTSATPNLVRALRRAYQQAFGAPEMRAAQKSTRTGALLTIGLGVVMATVHHWGEKKPWGPMDWWLLILGFALLALSYFETGNRRSKPGEGAIRLVLILVWLWQTGKNDNIAFGAAVLSSLEILRVWPLALWPIRRRIPPQYSVLTPIVHFRQRDGSLYATTTIASTPGSMERPTLGFGRPAKVPAEDVVEGVTPLAPTLARSFPADESIRLFTVVNANPDIVHATLEVRSEPDHAVVRRVPMVVTKATPKLPPPKPFGFDEFVATLPKWPVSALDVVLPLTGLAPGHYNLRLVATEGTMTSSQDEAIEISPADKL